MKRIAIHSVPRSGSSWVGQIFNSSPSVIFKFQPLFSYALKSFLNENSSKQEIDRFFKKLTIIKDDFIDQIEQINNGNYPIFSKTEPEIICYKEVRYHYILENLLEKDEDIKIIGIVRNPYAVISSWLKASKEFKKELNWKELEEWRFAPKKNNCRIEEYNGYEKWKEVAGMFLDFEKKFPNNFYLLKYSDLLANTQDSVKKIFSFCEIEYSPQTERFISESLTTNKTDAYSVYKKKNKVDIEYKKFLNVEIINEISKDIKNTELEKFL